MKITIKSELLQEFVDISSRISLVVKASKIEKSLKLLNKIDNKKVAP